MGDWKVPYHGATEEFLRSLVGTSEKECIEWPYAKNAKGYGIATINGKQRGAHNWMCRLVYGEPYLIWRFAAHRCGNPGCVNPNHLRWATPRENAADRRGHGTENIGENSGKTHLTEEDVREIRAAPPFYGPLIEKFGLTRGAISKIRSGKRWGHVEGVAEEKIGSQSKCRHGHPYDEQNTLWWGGYRRCRACDRIRARAKRGGLRRAAYTTHGEVV